MSGRCSKLRSCRLLRFTRRLGPAINAALLSVTNSWTLTLAKPRISSRRWGRPIAAICPFISQEKLGGSLSPSSCVLCCAPIDKKPWCEHSPHKRDGKRGGQSEECDRRSVHLHGRVCSEQAKSKGVCRRSNCREGNHRAPQVRSFAASTLGLLKRELLWFCRQE